jgi:hypothetical protein
MTKANMMREAHKMAKTFEGNYSACLALALRTLNRGVIEMKGTEKQIAYAEILLKKNAKNLETLKSDLVVLEEKRTEMIKEITEECIEDEYDEEETEEEISFRMNGELRGKARINKVISDKKAFLEASTSNDAKTIIEAMKNGVDTTGVRFY